MNAEQDIFADLSRKLLTLFAMIAVMMVVLVPTPVDACQGRCQRPHKTATVPEPTGEQLYQPATDAGSPYNVAIASKIAWQGGTQTVDYTGSGVNIALIDTGVVDAPGLRNSNVIIGPDFSLDYPNETLRARDANGHGTHLAGIMVASDEEWLAGDTERRPDRVLGIAPDASLISVKVGAADGAADITQVIAAINWVIEHKNDPIYGADVMVLAYSTDSHQPSWLDPLSYAVERAWKAGIVVVVAAGNDGKSRLSAPASNPYVITVAAVGSPTTEAVPRKQMVPTEFTSTFVTGRTPDLAAPGGSVVSLRNVGSYSDQYNEAGRVEDDLVRGSGTSQAAAVVGGAAAVLLEQRPELTPDQVKYLLTEHATTLSGDERVEGAGLLNVKKSLRKDTPPDATQSWEPAEGTGLIENARGGLHLRAEDVVLRGDIDIFGNSHWESLWTEDSFDGGTWIGGGWTGNTWTGNTWTGNTWTGNTWTGNTWTGNTWTGNTWTGNTWTGNTWTGNTWTGNTWTGNTWTGNTWTGNTWTGNTWTANAWN